MSIRKRTRYSNKKRYSNVSRKRTRNRRDKRVKSIRKKRQNRHNRHTRKQRGGSTLTPAQETIERKLLVAHTFVESLKKTEPIKRLKDLIDLIDLRNKAIKYKFLYLKYTDETNSKMLEEIKRIKASKGYKHLNPIENLRKLVEGLIGLANRYLDLVEVIEERHAKRINYRGDDLTSEDKPHLLSTISGLLDIIWDINLKRSSQLRLKQQMNQYLSLRDNLNYILGCFHFIKGESGYNSKNRYYVNDFKEATKYFEQLSEPQSLNKDKEIRAMFKIIGDRIIQFEVGHKDNHNEQSVRSYYENGGNVMVQIELYYPGAGYYGLITDGIILSNLNGTVTLTYNETSVEFQITGGKIESPSVSTYIASRVFLKSSPVADKSKPFIKHCLDSVQNGLVYEPSIPYIGPSSKKEYGNRLDQFNKENFYNFIVNTVFGRLFSRTYEYESEQDSMNIKANRSINVSQLPKYLAKNYQEGASVILTIKTT